MKRMRFFCLSMVVCSVLSRTQEIQIKPIAPFSYAYLECGGSYEQIPSKIGIFMQEFFKQKLRPTGEFFGLYLNSPQQVKEEELKWRLVFPVARETAVSSPLEKGEFPYTQVAVCLYVGPYDNVGIAYGRISEFIKNSGYEAVGPTMEKYLDPNPQAVNPAELRTEINVPVKKK